MRDASEFQPSGPVNEYVALLLEAARQRVVDAGDEAWISPLPRAPGRAKTWDGRALSVISVGLKKAENDEFWGLIGPARIPFGLFRYVCEVGTKCDNLGEAMQYAFRLFSSINPGLKLSLECSGGIAAIVMDCAQPNLVWKQFVLEWWMWQWYFTMQWFLREQVRLFDVCFHYSAIAAENNYAVFGKHVRFGSGITKMRFDASVLNKRVLRTISDIDDMYAKSSINLSVPELPGSIRNRVWLSLSNHLKHTGELPTLLDLATECGMCSQTLRRWLKKENIVYRNLKDEVRLDIVRQQIASGNLKAGDVASRAGFAEVKSLSRVVRKTYGLSFEGFRDRVLTTNSELRQ